MPVRRAGAANADLRVPARLRSRTQRLPCRATRNGRRGPRASTKPSPLPAIRNAYERPVSAREPVRSCSAVSRGGAGALWRSRREAGGSCAATRGLSGRREPGYPARRRAMRHHAPKSPRLAASEREITPAHSRRFGEDRTKKGPSPAPWNRGRLWRQTGVPVVSPRTETVIWAATSVCNATVSGNSPTCFSGPAGMRIIAFSTA